MRADQHNADFATVMGDVTSVTAVRADGQMAIGEGLSTSIVVGNTLISVAYWRLIKAGTTQVTSIEDGQSRSGPPIDAVGELAAELVGRPCLGLAVDPGTGDLLVTFSDEVRLQAFRFRSLFEDWEVRLPDGEAYWSNMVTLHP